MALHISSLLEQLAWAQRVLRRGNRLLYDSHLQLDPNAARDKEESDDDIEEVGSTVTSDGKRPRGGNYGDGGRAAKRRVLSADESRLTENYTRTPKDAITIGLPTYDAKEDWDPPPQRTQQTKMAAGSRRGVQPQNNLNKPAPQGGKSNRTNGNARIFKQFAAKGSAPGRLQTLTSRESNVTARPDFPEEHIGTTERPLKRQKTGKSPPSHTVDLTEDDDFDDTHFGKILGREKKGMLVTTQTPGSELHKKAKMPSEISSSHEQHSVDEMLEVTENPKIGRPSTNGNLSSHASAKGSERGRFLNGESRRHLETRTSPIVLIEDDAHQTSERSNVLNRNSQAQPRARRLPIELDKGFEEAGREYYAKRGQTRGEVSQGTNDSKNRTRRNGASGQTHTSQQKAGLPSQRMANMFRREGESQAQADASAQRQTNGRHSLTSDDELSGAKTVVSASSRNASPQKTTSGRFYEPSSIKPTNFTRGGQALANRRTQVSVSAAQADEIEEADDARIPIAAIFCKACVMDQNGLELLWDSELSAFVLMCNKQRARTPNRKQFVQIGSAEVRQWVWSNGHPGVVLRGSLSEVSSGIMLIQFENYEGANECHETLLAAINHLKSEHKPPDVLQKTFDNQRPLLELAHKKEKDRVDKPQQLIQDRRVRRQIPQPDDEEQIVYEIDEQPRSHRPKVRERMEGGPLAEVIDRDGYQGRRHAHEQDGEASKYFQDDAPRRSGRQSKPVQIKERPASPEKWTRNNSIKRWTHSVVYPEQGLRRVTVDFQDLERLDEGEFLNDNVINFELRRIEENMAPEHRAKVHFFNTFFFSSLSRKNGKKAFNYDAVSRWTKKIDLFTIPYVVVPINVELHWFVAIICNLPNIPRRFNGFGDDEEGKEQKPSTTNCVDGQEDQTDWQAADAENAAEAPEHASSSPKSDVFVFGDDGKVAANCGVEAEQAPSSSRPSTATGKKGKKKGSKPPKKYDTRDPIIMSLDSFNIMRSAEIKYLKLYVSAEAKTKREMELEYSDLQGMSAKGIPEQPNFCDCGVYLLGYVAEFAKNPDAFVRKVLTREMDRDNDFAGFDASAKRNEIRDELLKLQETQESERIAQKKAKQAAKSGKTTTSQTRQVPADASKETSVPNPTAQKLSTPASVQPETESTKPNASRENATPLSKVHLQSGARSIGFGPNNEDDDLEVDPPNFVGQSSSVAPVSNAADDGKDDENDEMLLDDINDGEDDEAAEESMPKRKRSLGVYKKQLPVPPSSAAAKDSTPLRNLEGWVHADDSERPERPKPHGPTNIDIGVGEDEEMAAEIPDSQEEAQPPRRKGRHTKFDSG